LYYRETFGLLLGASTAVAHDAVALRNFGPSWVRAGKILQDLILKFGAAPLMLGAIGLRSLDRSMRAASLLLAWMSTALVLAVAGLTTPITLRFEYFATPAVAALAGLGIHSLVRHGRKRWALIALAVTFGIQATIALFLLLDRFALISVILESPRWPFPFGPS
jgi:hypothetical protein